MNDTALRANTDLARQTDHSWKMLKRGLSNILQKHASDVVFVSALRTPVTRAKKGGFRDTYPEELLAHVCPSPARAAAVASAD